MVERTEYVKNYDKPKNSEIKHINGHWYLYEKTPYYDKVKKRMMWRSGKIIGKITPDGLVLSTHRAPKPAPGNEADANGNETALGSTGGANKPEEPVPSEAELRIGETLSASSALQDRENWLNGTHKLTKADVTMSQTVETAAVGFLYRLTGEMREALKYAFPGFWVYIYVVAMLRAISVMGGRFCKIEGQYKRSYLSHLYPGLDLSKEAMTEFLEALGMLRNDIVTYMEYMRAGDEHVALVDGHRIICSSKGIKIARLGYDTKHRYKPQINLVYLFAKSEGSIGMPEFYKQYSGSTNDMKALEDIVKESSLTLADITLVGDKGCTSAEVTEAAEKSGANYVLGIKRGTYGLSEKTPTIYEYQGEFSYHSRGIRYFSYECEDHKSKIIVYFDCFLFASEASSRIAKRELAAGKDVKKAQKDLDHRRKELAKAEKAMERAQSAVARAESRVTLTNGDLIVAQRKKEEAEAQVTVKSLSLESKQDNLRAAKSESKKEYAAGVVARAEASEAKAKAELARVEAAYYKKDLQLIEEQKKLSSAQESLEMARVRLRQRQESVKAGEKLLAIAEANSDDLAAILAANSELKDELTKVGAITRETGTFALKTNRMDLSAEEVYLLYKQRPAIEEFFKIYDKTLRFDASYMQNVSSTEAWMFLNHLSATMAVLALQNIADSGQSNNVSFNGLMDMLSSVRATEKDGCWSVDPVDDNIMNICKRMGYDPRSIPSTLDLSDLVD